MAIVMCAGHGTDLAGESPVTGICLKCSGPQAEDGDVQVKEVDSKTDEPTNRNQIRGQMGDEVA